MSRVTVIYLSILLCLGMIGACMVTFAQSNNIAVLNNTINAIKAEIVQDSVERDSLLQALKNTEVSIGTLNQTLAELNNKVAQVRLSLNKLNHQQSSYQTQLDKEEKNLAEELRAFYLFKRNHAFNALFNQNAVTDLSRNATYFKYLNRSRLESMQKITLTLTEINQNQTEIAKQNQQLTAILTKKQAEQNQLEILKSNRSKIMDELNKDIARKEQELSTLEKNKAALENLLSNLAATPRVPVQPPLPFEQMQGHFSWPTRGKIVQTFGEQLGNSQLTSTGVILQAPQGQPIYAIYPGKIVFADWLKGFGLLTIIDHGGGYMTLYGRNNALYHKVGDFVNKGELIATVGNSGGYQQNGLYFEIRKNGQPLNPTLWCQL